jgi:hypothetical protein
MLDRFILVGLSRAAGEGGWGGGWGLVLPSARGRLGKGAAPAMRERALWGGRNGARKHAWIRVGIEGKVGWTFGERKGGGVCAKRLAG